MTIPETPVLVTTADVYALGMWITNILYLLVSLGLFKFVMMIILSVVVIKATRRMNKASEQIEALAQVANVEGRLTDARKERTERLSERTQQTLDRIQTDLPRVAHEVVREVVAAMPVAVTPTEGTLKVVVTNPPDKPVPVDPRIKPNPAT